MRTGTAAILALAILTVCQVDVCAEDNTSTLITNVTDNIGTNYFVGNTGANNSLTISGGGILTNVYDAYIGYEASASNNWVVIDHYKRRHRVLRQNQRE
jgi:hypothetical protein